MKTNKVLRNVFNVFLNIFGGWISFWYFAYSLLFITDRKDEEAESLVPFGYLMLIIGLPIMIIFRIVQLLTRENKKDYWIYNILPMLATLILMILWSISVELGYESFW